MTSSTSIFSSDSQQNVVTVPNAVVARAAARKLWIDYGFESVGELQLEDVAFAEGVIVAESPLESADAWLVRGDRRGIIRIRSSIPEPGRKRFAIAHELGHWFLHKHVSQLFACTSEDLAARYRGSPVEIEANLFASELLMPSTLFASRARDASPNIRHLERLASEFQTSFTATAIRYIECSSQPCAVVCSRENDVRWWMASRSFANLCGSAGGKPLNRGSNEVHEPGAISLGASCDQSLAALLDSWSRIPALQQRQHEILAMPEYRQKLHLFWL